MRGALMLLSDVSSSIGAFGTVVVVSAVLLLLDIECDVVVACGVVMEAARRCACEGTLLPL